MLGPGSLRFDPPACFAESLGEIAKAKIEERVMISQSQKIRMLRGSLNDEQETSSMNCENLL